MVQIEMPTLLKPLTPRDGRQSDTALAVPRGTRRLLRRLDYSTLTELPLLTGRRADIVALAMDATIIIVEIKSSVADFRADAKWREYRAHCDKFYFAIPESVPSTSCPRTPGSFWPMPMAAIFCGKRRSIAWPQPRAVLMRFAPAAAHRLHRLSDPGGWRRAAGVLQVAG
jgi:hypothetical protein